MHARSLNVCVGGQQGTRQEWFACVQTYKQLVKFKHAALVHIAHLDVAVYLSALQF